MYLSSSSRFELFDFSTETDSKNSTFPHTFGYSLFNTSSNRTLRLLNRGICEIVRRDILSGHFSRILRRRPFLEPTIVGTVKTKTSPWYQYNQYRKTGFWFERISKIIVDKRSPGAGALLNSPGNVFKPRGRASHFKSDRIPAKGSTHTVVSVEPSESQTNLRYFCQLAKKIAQNRKQFCEKSRYR